MAIGGHLTFTCTHNIRACHNFPGNFRKKCPKIPGQGKPRARSPGQGRPTPGPARKPGWGNTPGPKAIPGNSNPGFFRVVCVLFIGQEALSLEIIVES